MDKSLLVVCKIVTSGGYFKKRKKNDNCTVVNFVSRLSLVFTSDASTGVSISASTTALILFLRENGPDARISTSSRIKIFPFPCACAYACVMFVFT